MRDRLVLLLSDRKGSLGSERLLGRLFKRQIKVQDGETLARWAIVGYTCHIPSWKIQLGSSKRA